MYHIINIVVGLIMLFAQISLQISLSKRKNKWIGLILPCITFFATVKHVMSLSTTGMTTRELFLLIVKTFFIWIIPNIILIGTYLFCRKKINRLPHDRV